MGGFDFIQGAAEDFICAADFILASQGFHSSSGKPLAVDQVIDLSPISSTKPDRKVGLFLFPKPFVGATLAVVPILTMNGEGRPQADRPTVTAAPRIRRGAVGNSVRSAERHRGRSLREEKKKPNLSVGLGGRYRSRTYDLTHCKRFTA